MGVLRLSLMPVRPFPLAASGLAETDVVICGMVDGVNTKQSNEAAKNMPHAFLALSACCHESVFELKRPRGA